MEREIINRWFWVRTPTALISKQNISPEDYQNIESIEGEYSDGSRFISEINKSRKK